MSDGNGTLARIKAAEEDTRDLRQLFLDEMRAVRRD